MSVKSSVLETLENNRGTYVSGEKLSEELGVSRSAVWKAIHALRREGYPVEAVTNKGYTLPRKPLQITEEEIRRYLPARYRNQEIRVYDVIDSTNTQAHRIAAEGGAGRARPVSEAQPSSGKPAGLSPEDRSSSGKPGLSPEDRPPSGKPGPGEAVVLARQQTGGKGRLGRSFFSPEEGLYLSLLVKPELDLSRSILVTVAAAAAVAEAVDEVCGADTRIKWVNDIYLDGKKICGILTEGITDFETGQVDHLVIGIGINTTLKGFPAELLKTAGAVEGDYSRSALAARVITNTLDYLEDLEDREYMRTYRDKSMLTGKDVKVFQGVYRRDPEKDLSGRPAKVLGIDDDGGLQVIYTDGSRQTLTTGEVTVRQK